MRVAACISGDPKALVVPSYRSHLLAVLAPLRGLEDANASSARGGARGVDLDIYFNLNGARGATIDARTDAGRAELTTLRRAFRPVRVRIDASPPQLNTSAATASWPSNRSRSCHGMMRCNADGCATSGYEQAVRMRGCLRDIEAFEGARRRRYDYVLRMRPDLEYASRLPAPAEWRRLRADVILVAVIALNGRGREPGTYSGTSPGNASSDGAREAVRTHGGRGEVELPSLREVAFIDDALAIMPRDVATHYLGGVADAYERCITPVSPTKSCGRRRYWVECHYLGALERAAAARATEAGGDERLYVAPHPAARGGFSIVDCPGREIMARRAQAPGWLKRARNMTSLCSKPDRRRDYATVWNRTAPAHAFLSADLETASFPRGALLRRSAGHA